MKHSLKSNYLYNLLYQILLIILPLITTPYISRVLGSNGIGTINYTGSVTAVAVLIASLGSGLYAQKEIAYAGENIQKRSKIFWSILLIRIISSLIVSILYIIICYFSDKYRSIYLIQYITLVANMLDIVWLFQGIEDFKKISIRNIIIKLVSVTAIFLFVKDKNDITIYIFINSISALGNSLLMWLYLHGIIIKCKISWNDISKHIYPIITLFIPMIAIYVYTYVDKIVLGLLSSEEQVGFYSNAERIVKLPMTVITSLGSVMLPRIARLIKKNMWPEVRIDIRNSIHFVFFLGFPMTAGIAIIAPFFVPWFFGHGYESCIFLMQCLSVIIIIIGMSSVTGQAVLVPLNKQKIYTISIVIGAITNIVLNLILIPIFGAAGAVIGTISAESIVGVIQWTSVFKGIKLRLADIIRDNLKPLCGTLVMFIVLALARPFFAATPIYTVIYGIAGVIVYFIVMVILKDEIIKIIINYIITVFRRK